MNFKESETAQKLGGAYYTPEPIAHFLASWVNEISPDSILEPSCGDGAFVDAMAAKVPKLKRIVAVDIDRTALGLAKEKVLNYSNKSLQTNLIEDDFLSYSFDAIANGEKFDAILGNPPFIRYQYLDKIFQDRTERAFADSNLKFTKHTNAWVPFVIQSLRLLKPGGRLGMVIPTELMHVLHANSLRQFILANCKSVAVVHLEELFSEEVLQGVILLLCEKTTEKLGSEALIAFPHANNRNLLNGHAAEFINSMPYISSKGLDYKWMEGLLTPEEAGVYRDVQKLPGIKKFTDIADVDVGIVTGANKFFLVEDETIKKFDLQAFAYPMFGRSSHVRGVRMKLSDLSQNEKLGLPTNFLRFPSLPIDELPAGAQKYIRLGEQEGLHTRYKCRIRTPWYVVPSVWAADVAMLKRAHNTPRLICNEANAFTTDTAYRLTMLESDEPNTERFVWNFVNSLTALSAELEGRHYGGGVIEMVPSEIERLVVPYALGGKSELKVLDDQYRNGMSVFEILEAQDKITLEAVGVSVEQTKVLNAAWQRLKRRRQRDHT